MKSRACFSLLALLIVASIGGVAVAADDAEALISQGLELRKRGDDLGALPLFVQAHQLSPTARAAAQRGFCEQALGRWADAEVHLSEALKSAGDPWVKRNRSLIERSLAAAKAKVAVIEVFGEPPGGQVLVNGAVVGRLPLAQPLRVGAGELDVEVRAPGHRSATKALRIEGGQYQRLVLRAEPQASPGAGGVATGGGSSRAATEPSSGEPGATATMGAMAGAPPSGVSASPEGAPAAGGPSPARAAAKWVSFGLGTAAFGVGLYGVLRHGSLVADFNADCAIDPATGPYALPSSTRSDDSCRSLKSDYESDGTLGVVGLVGAGVLVTTGIVLWLTEPGSSRTNTALVCAPELGAHGGTLVGCSLRF